MAQAAARTGSQPSPPLQPHSNLPDTIPRHPETGAQRTWPKLLGVRQWRHTGTNNGTSSNGTPFAGRLGGNQEFVVDRSNPANAQLLSKLPDAAPNLSLTEAFDLRGFRETDLYKAALIECFGTMVLVFAASWNSLSPPGPPPPPSPSSGVFGTSFFIAPLVAACINAILITLLTFSFGAVSGAHMNPLITIGTFFARLTSFPRLVLYMAAQTSGAALAGLFLRAGAGTRDFKVGGCYLFEDMVPISSAFTVEFVGSLLLLLLAFGVGLDPRQRGIFGPAVAPIFVGLAAGSCALCFSFSRPGYGGASLNPARCFGVFVGSRFPGWHWIHWVGPIAAGMLHGGIYFLVPPGSQPTSPVPAVERNATRREKSNDDRGVV
ncbi:hypothetical protein A1O1_05063 [Capronia coronata CBS 617.96]|uniref:Aquaporin rerated protein, other eukaryote n=1 Tax=Capronia coronata CBS 617.96 TaxID=1182541 RepID=W9YEN6_9EURO|nr:uncharacterized protein A1O1_05063 [Capronia coronata CBS 617.96]EXJ88135.1 hypothetical protein A1O1_05063 [Capronia coronata CBS 617.96]